MRVLVTGGAGFLGANFVRHTLEHRPEVATDRPRLVRLRRESRHARTAPGPRERGARGCRGRRVDRPLGRRARRRRAPRRGVAQRQRAARPRAVRARQCGRDVHGARGGTPPRRAAASRLDRRGLRRPGARRPDSVHRGVAVPPVQSRTARPRPAPTTWCAPGSGRTGSRRRSRTAPTTTGRTSTSKSSSRARSPTSSRGDVPSSTARDSTCATGSTPPTIPPRCGRFSIMAGSARRT